MTQFDVFLSSRFDVFCILHVFESNLPAGCQATSFPDFKKKLATYVSLSRRCPRAYVFCPHICFFVAVLSSHICVLPSHMFLCRGVPSIPVSQFLSLPSIPVSQVSPVSQYLSVSPVSQYPSIPVSLSIPVSSQYPSILISLSIPPSILITGLFRKTSVCHSIPVSLITAISEKTQNLTVSQYLHNRKPSYSNSVLL